MTWSKVGGVGILFVLKFSTYVTLSSFTEFEIILVVDWRFKLFYVLLQTLA